MPSAICKEFLQDKQKTIMKKGSKPHIQRSKFIPDF